MAEKTAMDWLREKLGIEQKPTINIESQRMLEREDWGGASVDGAVDNRKVTIDQPDNKPYLRN